MNASLFPSRIVLLVLTCVALGCHAGEIADPGNGDWNTSREHQRVSPYAALCMQQDDGRLARQSAADDAGSTPHFRELLQAHRQWTTPVSEPVPVDIKRVFPKQYLPSI